MKTKIIMLAIFTVLIACKKKTTTPEPTPSTTGGNTTPTDYTLTIKVTPQPGAYAKLWVDLDYKYNYVTGSGNGLFYDTICDQIGTLIFTKTVTNDTIGFQANSHMAANGGGVGACDIEVKINNVVKYSWTNEVQPIHYIKIK